MSLHPHTLRSAAILIALGIPGLATLLPVLPEIPGVPRLALLINPAILLVAGALAGAWCAPRCGFRSTILNRAIGADRFVRLRSELRDLGFILAMGVALGFVMALADQLAAPLWRTAETDRTIAEAWSMAALTSGIGYGGVVEEIVMRWGLMSALVWLLWRGVARRHGGPGRWAIALGILLSSVLFAAGHLPALMVEQAPGTALIARTFALNLLAGSVFGAVFALRDLEHAMACHIGFHIGFAVFATL